MGTLPVQYVVPICPEAVGDNRPKHVPGLALMVTPTGHKSFVYGYRFKKKVKRFTIGGYSKITLSTARDEARELSYRIGKGEDPLAERQKQRHRPDPKIFRELADDNFGLPLIKC